MLKFLGFLALLWLIGVPMGAIEVVFWISVVAVGVGLVVAFQDMVQNDRRRERAKMEQRAREEQRIRDRVEYNRAHPPRAARGLSRP